jgi:predicted nucleic acid-binding protein
MIVVADTTPLNYLVLIDEIRLLPGLFDKVLIPRAVFAELQHPEASIKIRQWLAEAPIWLEVCQVALPASTLPTPLDAGEREAIQLALERGIETILIDEIAGRKAAEGLGLEARGTLGILEYGARLGLTSFRPALHKLEQTNFRISPAVKAVFIARNP